MRTPYRWNKCKCTGRHLEIIGVTCIHYRTCPIRKLQDKYGVYKVETYMFGLKEKVTKNGNK